MQLRPSTPHPTVDCHLLALRLSLFLALLFALTVVVEMSLPFHGQS